MFKERPPSLAFAPVYSMVWSYQFCEVIPNVYLLILKVGAFSNEVATQVHLS